MSSSDKDSDEEMDTSRALLEQLMSDLQMPSTEATGGLRLPLPPALLRPLLERLLQSAKEHEGDIPTLTGMFLPCENESESGMLEKRLKHWKSTHCSKGQGQFFQHFANQVGPFLKEDFNSLVRKPQSVQPRVAFPNFAYDGIMETLTKILQNSSVKSLATCIIGVLSEVLSQAHSNNAIGDVPQPSDSNHTYILDLCAVHDEHLKFLLKLFTKVSRNQDAGESLLHLLKYVPTKTLQKPGARSSPDLPFCTNCKQLAPLETQACFGCGKLYCSACSLSKAKIPSLCRTQKVLLCSQCLTEYKEQERDQWMDKGIQLLASDTGEDIQAAFVCFLIGLQATEHSSRVATHQVNRFAKQLINQGLSELALPLLSATSLQSEVPIESIRAHMMASNALESMAYNPNTLPQEQIVLLKAAKAECEAATNTCSTAVEIPDMSTRVRSLEKTLTVIESEAQRQFHKAKQSAHLKLQKAWEGTKWDEIFEVVSDTAADYLTQTDQGNPRMEAIKDLLSTKKHEINPENRTVLHMLTGFVNIFQGKIHEGFSNIESAMWGGLPNSDLFYKTAIDIVIAVIVYNPEIVQPLNVLQSACRLTADNCGLDPINILSSLHLKEEDLLPPFRLQWPTYRVPYITSIGTRQYEEDMVMKITQNKWTAKQVANSYLEYVSKCHHPAEVVICFLNASLWLLRSLKETSSDKSSLVSDSYSLKMAVMYYLTQAFIIANSCLHRGMQLYVARIAVGASLLATKLAESQATTHDAEQIVQFLYSFVHAARLCPFWKAPIILVSEAVLLNVMTGKQHSTFISALQHIPKGFCHLKQAELLYQLYENDFTDLQSSENPQDIKHQAMQELLEEKQLTLKDVSCLMKSSITPRCSEGWIHVQGKANMNLDYSAIKGLKVHLGGPSILNPPALDLLVISSAGTNGIVSQSDVDTFLTLDPEKLMPLYFSLDPPSRNEKYHPFQELRFHPDSIRNTEVLQTLFEADYIMKFLSIGSEVSAIPPFGQRPCIQGLISQLPPHLKEALKPVHERGTLRGNMFRFWIEAKEMKYDIEVTDNEVVVKCGDPEMVIKNHRIYFAPDGTVRDTEDESDPDSPQALFAADLTKHYSEIGHYFPAFARIRELCKLQLLSNYVKNNVVNFENGHFFKSSTFKQMVTDVELNAKISVNINRLEQHAPSCLWAPSAVYKKKEQAGAATTMLRAYGGVNLAPDYVKATLPGLPATTRCVSLSKRDFSVADQVSPQRSSHGSSKIGAATFQKLKSDDDSTSTSSNSGSFTPTFSSTRPPTSTSSRPRHLSSTSAPTTNVPQKQRHPIPYRSSFDSDSSAFKPQQYSPSSTKSPNTQTTSLVAPDSKFPSRIRTGANPLTSASKSSTKSGTSSTPTVALGTRRQPVKSTHSDGKSSGTYASGSKSSGPSIATSGQKSRTQPMQPTQSIGCPTAAFGSRPQQFTQSGGDPIIASHASGFKHLHPSFSSSPTATSGYRPQSTFPAHSCPTATQLPSKPQAQQIRSVYSPSTGDDYDSAKSTDHNHSLLQPYTPKARTSYVNPTLILQGLMSMFAEEPRASSLQSVSDEVATQVLAISHLNLPIAKCFLVKMLFPQPRSQPHILEKLCLAGQQLSQASVAHSSSRDTGNSGDSGGDGDGNGGSWHGGGNGGSWHGPPTVLTAVTSAIAVVIGLLKTSDIRDTNSQRAFRKMHQCTDRNMHAAHTLSLNVALEILHKGWFEGYIVDPPFKFRDMLRKVLNIFPNYELVPSQVNLVDHNRIDKALLRGAKEEKGAEERGKKVAEFFKKHLVEHLPLGLVKAFLELFFYPLGIFTEEEGAVIIKEKEMQSSPVASIPSSTAVSGQAAKTIYGKSSTQCPDQKQ